MAERNYLPQAPEIPQADIDVLKIAGYSDGSAVATIGDEVVVSSDALFSKLQPFPGATLPDLGARERFPRPDRPGEWCDRQTFLNAPKFMAQWVHWPSRVKSVLEGNYFDLAPAHFEGIFTLVCNFMCPHCTRRTTRLKWVEGGTWDNNVGVEEANTLHPRGLRRVIDQLASARVDGQMGIVWGGGDPTANPYTYDAMLYARSRGITGSFLTNGVFLDVERCLDAEPILIRISLNCGTEEAYRRFHGYPKGWDYFQRAKDNMRALVRAKLERKSKTLVGISLIVDERNMDDVLAAATEIKNVVEEAGPGIDYVIVRPVMNYAHFERDYAMIREGTKQRARDLVGPGGPVEKILADVGIPMIPIKDSFDEPPTEDLYEGSECLAYGLCGEIRHNGDVQLCSESYGNPEFTIGNLFQSDLADIMRSDKRREVLARMNEKSCFKTYCPHNSRGHHHNRTFHGIERMKREGRHEELNRWVSDLQACTLPLGHSFFI